MTLCQNCSNCSAPLNKMATRSKNRKTFKLLLLNEKMDFEIIIQECFLGDPLPKLLKWFRSVECMAARAINRNKLLMTSSKSVDRFWNNFTGMFLRWLSTKNCSNCSGPFSKMATRAKNWKTFKWLLLHNQCIDLEVIIQECSLDDCPPKLLKPVCFVQQNGHQGYK